MLSRQWAIRLMLMANAVVLLVICDQLSSVPHYALQIREFIERVERDVQVSMVWSVVGDMYNWNNWWIATPNNSHINIKSWLE